MAKIKAVLFDLDDTLLWDEKSVADAFRATCERAAEQHPLEPVKLEEAVRTQAKEIYSTYDFYPFTLNIGINPFEGLWGDFNDPDHEQFARMKAQVSEYRQRAWTAGLQALGIKDDPLGVELAEQFPRERRRRSLVYDDTYEVLDSLKEHYQLLLLTNGSPELQQEKLTAEPALAKYFEHIVVSGSFGQGKPARELFEHVMQLLEIGPEEGVMVGDKLTTDIKGALGVGMHSVWINRDQLKASEDIRPDFEINELSDLLDVLERLNKEE